jgi:hypothetical protein
MCYRQILIMESSRKQVRVHTICAFIQAIEIRRGRINCNINSCNASFIQRERGRCGSTHFAASSTPVPPPHPLPLPAHVPHCWILITINGWGKWGSCTACAAAMLMPMPLPRTRQPTPMPVPVPALGCIPVCLLLLQNFVCYPCMDAWLGKLSEYGTCKARGGE